MNLIKTTLTLISVSLLSAGAAPQTEAKKGQAEDLYQSIEFQMPCVQEPVIPEDAVKFE